MNEPGISVSKLLERTEYEIETANGRTARVCRDERGDFWVVDGAERVVSLFDFAGDCQVAAQALREAARGQMLQWIATGTRAAIARVAKAVQRAGAKPARA